MHAKDKYVDNDAKQLDVKSIQFVEKDLNNVKLAVHSPRDN